MVVDFAQQVHDNFYWERGHHSEEHFVLVVLLHARLDHLKGRHNEQGFRDTGTQARTQPCPLRQLAVLWGGKHRQGAGAGSGEGLQ